MNKQLIKLLNERIALLSTRIESNSPSLDEAEDNFTFIAASGEETTNEGSEEVFEETILVDFDFETEEQTDFDIAMTVRYFWKDWNPLYTEVF